METDVLENIIRNRSSCAASANKHILLKCHLTVNKILKTCIANKNGQVSYLRPLTQNYYSYYARLYILCSPINLEKKASLPLVHQFCSCHLYFFVVPLPLKLNSMKDRKFNLSINEISSTDQR